MLSRTKLFVALCALVLSISASPAAAVPPEPPLAEATRMKRVAAEVGRRRSQPSTGR